MSAGTLAIDDLEFIVDLRRGPEGTGVCVCKLRQSPGKKFNVTAVQAVLDHTRCNSGGVKTSVETNVSPLTSQIICEVELNPEDEDEEAHRLHVQTIAQGIMAGIVDCLAVTDEAIVLESGPSVDPGKQHEQVVKALAS